MLLLTLHEVCKRFPQHQLELFKFHAYVSKHPLFPDKHHVEDLGVLGQVICMSGNQGKKTYSGEVVVIWSFACRDNLENDNFLKKIICQ